MERKKGSRDRHDYENKMAYTLRKETRITLYVGLGVSVFALLMVWGWYSDFKERRDIKKSLEWDVWDEPASPRESGDGAP